MSKTSLELISEIKEQSRVTNALVSNFGIDAKFLLELGGKLLFGQLQAEDIPALKATLGDVKNFVEEIEKKLAVSGIDVV